MDTEERFHIAYISTATGQSRVWYGYSDDNGENYKVMMLNGDDMCQLFNGTKP